MLYSFPDDGSHDDSKKIMVIRNIDHELNDKKTTLFSDKPNKQLGNYPSDHYCLPKLRYISVNTEMILNATI